jgi:hypothetical protein
MQSNVHWFLRQLQLVLAFGSALVVSLAVLVHLVLSLNKNIGFFLRIAGHGNHV